MVEPIIDPKTMQAYKAITDGANSAAKALEGMSKEERKVALMSRAIMQARVEEGKAVGVTKSKIDEEIKAKRLLVSQTDLLKVATEQGVEALQKSYQAEMDRVNGIKNSTGEISKLSRDAVQEAISNAVAINDITGMSGKQLNETLKIIGEGFTSVSVLGSFDAENTKRRIDATKKLNDILANEGTIRNNITAALQLGVKGLGDETKAREAANKIIDQTKNKLNKIATDTEGIPGVFDNIGRKMSKFWKDLKVGERGAWAAVGGTGFALEKMMLAGRKAIMETLLPLGGSKGLVTGGAVEGGQNILNTVNKLRRMGYSAEEASNRTQDQARQGYAFGKGIQDLPELMKRTLLKGVAESYYGLSSGTADMFTNLMTVNLGRSAEDSTKYLEFFNRKVSVLGGSTELYTNILNQLLQSSTAYGAKEDDLADLTVSFASGIRKGRFEAGELARALTGLRNASFGTQVGMVSLGQRFGATVPGLTGSSPLETIGKLMQLNNINNVDLFKMQIKTALGVAGGMGRTDIEKRGAFGLVGEKFLPGATRPLLDEIYNKMKEGSLGNKEAQAFLAELNKTEKDLLGTNVENTAKMVANTSTLIEQMERSIAIAGTGFVNIQGALTVARTIELMGLLNALIPGGGTAGDIARVSLATAMAALGPTAMNTFNSAVIKEGFSWRKIPKYIEALGGPDSQGGREKWSKMTENEQEVWNKKAPKKIGLNIGGGTTGKDLFMESQGVESESLASWVLTTVTNSEKATQQTLAGYDKDRKKVLNLLEKSESKPESEKSNISFGSINIYASDINEIKDVFSVQIDNYFSKFRKEPSLSKEGGD